jgi:hypothetical protein
MSDSISSAGPPVRLSDAATLRTRAGAAAASPGWRAAIILLVLVIWLIPIKSYKLPVTLPFNLEVYRLLIVILLFAWLLSALLGRAELSAGGLGAPVILFVLAGVAPLFVNRQEIEAQGLQTQTIKSLSFELSFLVAFVLVCSTVRALRDIDAIVAVIVALGFGVAVAALIEQRTKYNAFDHLQEWVPFLKRTRGIQQNIRFGRLRVRGSAQHPIALGAALMMMVPLGFYLARRATTKAATWRWSFVSMVLAGAALATQSRTVVLMTAVMVLVGLLLRPQAMFRRWPLLLVLVVAVHFAAPRTLSGLWHAFHPKKGLLAEQQVRGGSKGSGRIADVSPGLAFWQQKPIFGEGAGTSPVRGAIEASTARGGDHIIFDDQYLRMLVEGGVVGFGALVWLLWGAVFKIGSAVKRASGRAGDLLAACTASTAAYAAGIITYDSLAFVQVTLLFFVVAALGLRARSVAPAASDL